MPLRLVEKSNGKFAMENRPRHEINKSSRRDNSKQLKALASFSKQANEWIEYLLQGPFHNDGSDDFRLAQDKRRDRQRFIDWSKKMGKEALYLAFFIKLMLAGEESSNPIGLNL